MLLVVAQKGFHDTPVAVDYRCHHRGIANLCISNTAILEKKRNDYTVWRQYNEMPSLNWAAQAQQIYTYPMT